MSETNNKINLLVQLGIDTNASKINLNSRMDFIILSLFLKVLQHQMFSIEKLYDLEHAKKYVEIMNTGGVINIFIQ